MQTQFYFWKPLMERHKKELSIIKDYYNRTNTQFDNIEEEARKYAKSLYNNYSFHKDTDLSDIAEWASQQEVHMYENLLRMKSNHLLMTISLLYHTWEQQLIKFTVNEMAHYFDFTRRVLESSDVQVIFDLHGVNIPKTKSWVKIKELKLLVNTVKHGDGDSASKLRIIRPDFFKVDFFDDNTDILELNGSVLLDGYSIRVTDSDFFDYVRATEEFWDEMPERAFSDDDLIIDAFQKKKKKK